MHFLLGVSEKGFGEKPKPFPTLKERLRNKKKYKTYSFRKSGQHTNVPHYDFRRNRPIIVDSKQKRGVYHFLHIIFEQLEHTLVTVDLFRLLLFRAVKYMTMFESMIATLEIFWRKSDIRAFWDSRYITVPKLYLSLRND